MKKTIFALICMVLVLGCAGTSNKNSEEKKLTVYQGLGILAFEPRGGNEAPPGGENYLSLVVRNNAGGANAENIVASIDNVEPFVIRDCRGDYVLPSTIRTAECVNPIFNDRNLPYTQHELTRLESGEEMEMLWLIRAPTGPEITQSEYSHTIYATLAYDYKVSAGVNIVALSQDEVTRRRTAKENYNIVGITTNTAGDLSINTQTTTQPIIFPSTGSTSPTYYLIFNVENVGQGLPQKKTGKPMRVTIYAPQGILVESTIAKSSDYGWTRVEPDADNTYTIINEDESLVNDVILGNTFVLPFRINEIGTLNNAGITEKTYTFFIDVEYSYIISSETRIVVKPF